MTLYRRIGKAIKIYFYLAQDSKGKRIEKINCIFLKFYAILWVYDIDNPIKKDDHSLDELRYFIMSRPENKPPKPEKSWVQKDKERLYSKLLRERRGV